MVRTAFTKMNLLAFAVAAIAYAATVLYWEKNPSRLFAIRIGNHFAALGIAGIILAVWR